MHEIDRVIAACRDIAARGARGVLITVVRTEGSTYRRAGARAVISATGEAVGAISGGCVERDLAERIKPWLGEMAPRIVRYDTTGDDDRIFGLGLGCRGVIDLLVEPFDGDHLPRLVTEFTWRGRETLEWTTPLPDGGLFVELVRPQRRVIVFGGGADALPVIRAAEMIGWDAELVTARTCHPSEVASKLDLAGYDAAVVMTHNFMQDVDIVRAVEASPIGYIGLLGPRSRGDELLEAAGVERGPRHYSPAGLDLGSETPEEIGVSIIAEVQAVLLQRSGGLLRDAQRAIHERPPVQTCA
ncbi:MAG: XdhC family protein [Thermoanaerobaculia bacterium]